ITAWSNALSRIRILPAITFSRVYLRYLRILVSTPASLFPLPASLLLEDLGNDACTNGAAALSDGEPAPLVHRDRRDQLDRHLNVVPRHHHLHTFRQLH